MKISNEIKKNKRIKGCWHHSEETKKKISIAHKGKRLSEEHKRKISIAHKCENLSDESRKRMSEAQKGKHPSREAIEKTRIAITGIHRSEEFKKNLSIARMGKNNPMYGKKPWNWKGGITPINKAIRSSKKYNQWRETVFVRDGWTCQKSNIKGGDLNVHHIKNFSDNPKLRFDMNNAITLSKKEHKKFHKIYGTKNNNQEQINEFLNNK